MRLAYLIFYLAGLVTAGDSLVMKGVVWTPADQPLADAKVSLFRTQMGCQNEFLKETVSDANGRFVFENLDAGMYEVHSTHFKRGLCSYDGEMTARAQLGDNQEAEPLSVYTEERTVLTVVVSQEDQQLLTNAQVSVDEQKRDVDETGRCRFFVGNEPVHLRVTAPHFIAYGGPHLITQDSEIRIGLKKGIRLKGRVLDEDGLPIVGARVSTNQENTKTNERGEYLLDHLNRGDRDDLGASAKGFLRAGPADFVANNGSLDVTLKREPQSDLMVRGRIVDVNGEPISTATVHPKDLAPIPVDEDGRFHFRPVDDNGWHFMDLGAPGYLDSQVSYEPGPEKSHTLHKPVSYTVRVTDTKGSPLPGVRCTWYSFNQKSRESDASGLIILDDVHPRESFKFEKPGYAPIEQDLTQSEEVILRRTGVLRGRVIDSQTGKGLPNFRLRMIIEFENWDYFSNGHSEIMNGMDIHSPQGEFNLQQIPVGIPFALQASAGETMAHKVIEVMIEETPGDLDVLVEIDTRVRTVQGRVVDNTGEPVANAHVQLLGFVGGDREKQATLFKRRDYYESFHRKEKITSTGRFKFENVSYDQQLDLLISAPGHTPKRVTGLEDWPEDSEETLVLEPGADLTITWEPNALPDFNHLSVSAQSRSYSSEYDISDQHDFPISGTSKTVGGFKPGSYLVSLESRKREYHIVWSQMVTLSEGMNRIQAGLDSIYSLSGRVISNKPIQSGFVRVTSRDTNLIRNAVLTTDGAYNLDRLQPGVYHLMAYQGSPTSESHPLKKGARAIPVAIRDQSVIKDIYLITGGRVTGLLPPSLQQAKLRLVGNTVESLNSSTQATGPVLNIENVAPGAYHLQVANLNMGYHTLAKLEVRSGETTNLGRIQPLGNRKLMLELPHAKQNACFVSLAPMQVGAAPLFTAFVFPAQKSYQITNLPQQNMRLRVYAMPGGHFERVITDEKSVAVSMTPSTSFALLFNQEAEEIPQITQAHLTHVSSGKQLQLKASVPLKVQYESGYIQNMVMAIGLDPGQWELSVDFENGKHHKQRLDLSLDEFKTDKIILE